MGCRGASGSTRAGPGAPGSVTAQTQELRSAETALRGQTKRREGSQEQGAEERERPVRPLCGPRIGAPGSVEPGPFDVGARSSRVWSGTGVDRDGRRVISRCDRRTAVRARPRRARARAAVEPGRSRAGAGRPATGRPRSLERRVGAATGRTCREGHSGEDHTQQRMPQRAHLVPPLATTDTLGAVFATFKEPTPCVDAPRSIHLTTRRGSRPPACPCRRRTAGRPSGPG